MFHRRSLLLGLAGLAVGSTLPRALAEPAIELNAELAHAFVEVGTEGTFAVLDLAHNRLIATDETRSRNGELPASTFKVPHALIALETGVVADADKEVIHWDGVTREIPEWNQDHTLRSAMKYSVVPVFQQIARRIGAERMQKYVDEFNYGNRDIGGAPIDKFWLEGNLRITPLEQIDFLTRLLRDDLPISQRNLDLVRDIVPTEKTGQATVHGKTGAVGRNGKLVLGWLVGWANRGEDTSVYAMNIDLHGPADLGRRMPLVIALLGKAGLI